MRRFLCCFVLGLAAHAQSPQGFTLQQVLSAPYATNLTAAPVGELFAWVEHTEGRHNLWVGGAKTPARQLTHNTEDDAQDITELAWSPDAAAIAYTYGAATGADGKPANPAHLQRATELTVIVQPIAADAKPVVVGEGHTPLFERLNHHLLFVRNGQIWISNLDGLCSPAPGCGLDLSAKTTSQLVYDRGSASQLVISPDGSTLVFMSRRREENEPSHNTLACFDFKTKALTFPAASTGNDSAPVFSPDGKQLGWLRAPFTDAAEFALNRVAAESWSIQIMDVATGTIRTVFSPEPNKPGSVMPRMSTGEPRLFWTADGRIVFSSEADGWNHLYAVDPNAINPKPLPRPLTPGEFEVEDPAVSGDGRTLVYAANDTTADMGADPLQPDPGQADRRHIYGLDLTQASPKPVFLTRGEGIEEHPALTANGGTLAALSADVRSPMMPAIITADGVVQPMRPGAAPPAYPAGALVTPTQVLFRASDGLQLHGQLFLPKLVTTKRPALIFFHGGPRRQMLLGYPAMDYYSNAYAMNQYLVSRGFIVLSVNYRCGIGYGLYFRQCAHGGADGASEYADVLAAQKYLASRPDVDSKRMGLWGGSYGGYLTALGLARNSDLFAVGVDFHGVHDWRLEDNASDWLRGSYAEKDAIAAKAFASSPLADVAKWRSPVLLIHGDDDPDVAYAQTPVLAEALRARNVPVETLIFPDEVHGFLLHRNWLAAYAAGATLFERVLKP